MKFLFDQSADFRLIPYLQNLGHDVAVISRHHPHGTARAQDTPLRGQGSHQLPVLLKELREGITDEHMPACLAFSGVRSTSVHDTVGRCR